MPEPSGEPNETLFLTATVSCNNPKSTVAENYPWSIPGAHNTVTKWPTPFGITQVRGKPNQFIICSDCPCPTAKQAVVEKPIKAKGTTAKNLKRTVIRFDAASHLLSEHQQKMLNHLYRSLADHYQLTITGYTDDTASGGTITNETLAQYRAEAALDYLLSLGLDKSRTTIKALPLCCYIASNDTDSGRALNRRAEIIISSQLTGKSL